MTAQEIIRRAKAEVGTVESPANSNKTKYGKWYGLDGQPWCAMFICWLFRDCLDLIKKTASCSTMLKYFRSKQMIVSSPKPGDIVFFKFNSKSQAQAEHIGLVVDVQANKIITIEGNTSVGNDANGGSVMERTRTGCIVAFARPNYDNTTVVNNSPTKSIDEVARLVIKGKYGSGNDRRQKLQAEGYNYTEVQKRVNEILKGK